MHASVYIYTRFNIVTTTIRACSTSTRDRPDGSPSHRPPDPLRSFREPGSRWRRARGGLGWRIRRKKVTLIRQRFRQSACAKLAAPSSAAAAERDRGRASLRVADARWSAPRAACASRCALAHTAPYCTGSAPALHHACRVSHKCLPCSHAVPRCPSLPAAPKLSSSHRLAAPARAASGGAVWCSYCTKRRRITGCLPVDVQVPLLPGGLFVRVQ